MCCSARWWRKASTSASQTSAVTSYSSVRRAHICSTVIGSAISSQMRAPACSSPSSAPASTLIIRMSSPATACSRSGLRRMVDDRLSVISIPVGLWQQPQRPPMRVEIAHHLRHGGKIARPCQVEETGMPPYLGRVEEVRLAPAPSFPSRADDRRSPPGAAPPRRRLHARSRASATDEPRAESIRPPGATLTPRSLEVAAHRISRRPRARRHPWRGRATNGSTHRPIVSACARRAPRWVCRLRRTRHGRHRR